MIDFACIAPHLQIRIEKKMDYFTRIEFQLTSKCGKNVVYFTKIEEVAHLPLIESTQENVYMYRESWDKYRGHPSPPWKTCDKISYLQHLPRFNLSELKIQSILSIASFIELCDRGLIFSNQLYLEWHHLGMGGMVLFFRLLEIFNVECLWLKNNDPLDEELFSFPKFCGISRILFNAYEIPDEKLLRLQSTTIILYRETGNRNCVTANLFLKEWFTKQRNIDLFEIRTKLTDWASINWMNEEILLSGLPYEIVWQYREQSDFEDKDRTELESWSGHSINLRHQDRGRLRKRHLYYRRNVKDFEYCDLNKKKIVYSIDRGDKKLLVYVGGRRDDLNIIDCLQAQEYTELEDVFSVTRDEY